MEWTNKNQKTIILIIEMIDNHPDCTNLNRLLELTELSRNTCIKYLNYLEDFLAENFTKDEIYLAYRDNTTIVYERALTFSFQRIYTAVYDGTLKLKLLNHFFYECYENLELFCQQEFISLSYGQKNLRYIRQELQKFDLGLDTKNSKFRGNERDIRSFLFYFYWSIYRGGDWPFQVVAKEQAQACALEIETALAIQLPESSKEILSYIVAIALTRQRYGNTCHLSVKEEQYIQASHLTKCLSPFLKEKQASSVPLFQEEWPYLCSVLEVLPGVQENPQYRAGIFAVHQKLKTTIFEISDYWLRSFTKFFSITLTEGQAQELMEYLIYYHQNAQSFKCYFRLFKHVNSPQPPMHSPDFEEQLHEFFTFLRQRDPSKFFVNREYLLECYRLLILKTIHLRVQQQVIRIELDTDKGPIHSALLQEQLTHDFAAAYQLVFVGPAEKSDFVLSTFPQRQRQESTVLFIRSTLNARDLSALGTLFTNYTKIKRKNK